MKTQRRMAFTGHRPGKGAGRSSRQLLSCETLLRERMQNFLNESEAVHAESVLQVSAAEGADWMALRIGEEMGFSLRVYLPLSLEEFAEDFEDSPEHWFLLVGFLEKISRNPRHELFAPPSGVIQRPDCYHATNARLLNGVERLLALWNGEMTRQIGGTSEMVEEAHDQGIEVEWLNPVTRRFQRWGAGEDRPE